jgi:hypothetical protein
MHRGEPFVSILETFRITNSGWVMFIVVDGVCRVVEFYLGGKDVRYDVVGGEGAVRQWDG